MAQRVLQSEAANAKARHGMGFFGSALTGPLSLRFRATLFQRRRKFVVQGDLYQFYINGSFLKVSLQWRWTLGAAPEEARCVQNTPWFHEKPYNIAKPCMPPAIELGRGAENSYPAFLSSRLENRNK